MAKLIQVIETYEQGSFVYYSIDGQELARKNPSAEEMLTARIWELTNKLVNAERTIE